MSTTNSTASPLLDTTGSKLDIGGIYIIVYARNPDTPHLVHWGLYYHHTPPPSGVPTLRSRGLGTKFHVKSMGSDNSWMMETISTGGMMKSFCLVGLLRVGSMDPAHKEDLEALISSVPPTAISKGGPFTCRIWVRNVLTALADKRIIQFTSLDAVEQEVFAFCTEQWQDTLHAVQPRPVKACKACYQYDA